jgi:lipid II:glycine glycyltransferase (peptidoglycan interpeptide bridge formation enzyme)
MVRLMSDSDKYTAEVDNITKNEWDTILPEFDDATIYQTWSYGAVRWGENNLSHLVLKDGNDIVGIAQAAVKKIPGIKTGIAYIPWGPLWKRKEKEYDSEVLRCLLRTIKREFAQKKGLFVRLTPHIIDRETDANLISVFREEQFKQNSEASRYRTFLIDLSSSLPDLRKKLDQKWRNQLNRSEKNGLTVHEGSSSTLYQAFMKLQKEMQERKNYIPGVDYDEFKDVQESLSDSQKMRCVLCEHEGEPVTATIATAIGDTGIYLLGATGDKGLQLKGAYLSQWLIIKWLKERGCKYYDLGGINPENNPGVYHFKAGLSGEDVSHIGQYEYSESYVSNIIVKLGEILHK